MAGDLLNIGYKTELTANDSAAKERPGTLRFKVDETYGLLIYRYVQAAADTTVANGTALAYTLDGYGMVVTSDISDSNQNIPAGIGIGAITASYYGWVQVGGYHSAIKTDAGDDFVVGDSIILHATSDGVVDRTASGTAAVCKPLGLAVAADVDASDTVAGILQGLI